MQAADLGEELKGRRAKTVASILGRVKVTDDQAAAIMAGSAASRILDLLISMPDAQERVALLPDCFTPPDPNAAPSDQPQVDENGQETEALWCTPAQLLTEIEARLRAVKALEDGNDENGQTKPGGASSQSRMSGFGSFSDDSMPGMLFESDSGEVFTGRQLAPVEGQLVGPELIAGLQDLRNAVKGYFMSSLEEKTGRL